MLGKALIQGGKPYVPLVPVMPSADSVELEPKVMLRELRRELSVCRQQTFLFSASQKKERYGFRICGPYQNKRIVIEPRPASRETKDRVKVPRLLKALYGKCATGNVNGWADSTCENK